MTVERADIAGPLRPSPVADQPFSSASRRSVLAPLLRTVGVLPFLAFTLLFLIMPTLYIVLGAFQTADGGWTLENMLALREPSIRNAYWVSIKVSVASALLGCLIGFAMAAGVVLGGLPRWIRSPLLTFSGVASNFAGVPLA